MSSWRTRFLRWARSAFDGSSRQARPRSRRWARTSARETREQRPDDVAAPRTHARRGRSPRRRAGAGAAASPPGRRACGRPRSPRPPPRPRRGAGTRSARGARPARGRPARAPPGRARRPCPSGTGRRAARTARRRRPRPRPSPAAGRGRDGRPRGGSPGGDAGRRGRRRARRSPPRRRGRPRASRRGAAAPRPAGPDRRPRRGTAASRLGASIARGAWWRCRDSNPGRRGYEPRALTS